MLRRDLLTLLSAVPVVPLELVETRGEKTGATNDSDSVVQADGDAPWPRFKCDPKNTGKSASATGPRDGVTESWRFETGGGRNSPPVVDSDTVYVGGDGLYALDRETGAKRWEFRVGENRAFSGPAVGDGVVCSVNAAEYHNVLYGVNAADGSERWSHELDGQMLDSPVTVVEGTAYVTGPDETVAIDVSSGEREWASSPGMGVEDNSVPAITDDTVYVSDSAGVRALDRTDGTERWTYDISDSLSPVVSDGRVYVAGYQGDQWRVVGVDTETGTGKWQVPLGDADIDNSPTILDDKLFIQAGSLHAIDVETGEELWTSPHGPSGFYLNPPVTDGERLYIVNSDNDYAAALDPEDGGLQWRFDLQESGGGAGTMPTLAGSTVFAHGAQTLHALVPDNDPPVADATHEPEDPTTGEPITFDASASSDPDDSIAAYEWDVGDSGTVDATGRTATFAFAEPGSYTVVLTVEDERGATDSIRTAVSVSQPTATDRQQSSDTVETTASTEAGAPETPTQDGISGPTQTHDSAVDATATESSSPASVASPPAGEASGPPRTTMSETVTPAAGVLAAVIAGMVSTELLVVVGVAVVAVLIVLTWERQVEGR